MLTCAGPHFVLGGVDTQRPAFERAENVFLVASLNQRINILSIYIFMHLIIYNMLYM